MLWNHDPNWRDATTTVTIDEMLLLMKLGKDADTTVASDTIPIPKYANTIKFGCIQNLACTPNSNGLLSGKLDKEWNPTW